MAASNGNVASSVTQVNLTQVNSNQALSEPMDFDGIIDSETQFVYQWNEEQRSVIQDCRAYLSEMLAFVESLENSGPEGKILPRKPQKDIASLLVAGKKESSKLLSGIELHQYLVKNIVGKSAIRGLDRVSAVKPETLQVALTYLKRGNEVLKRNNCVNLRVCIDYGEWLNKAFELHYVEKLAGTVPTWKEWVKTEIGIQDSYARKLREIAKLLGSYPRFRSLGLSFSQVYQHRRQIENMLMVHSNVAEFWKQGC